MSISASHRLLQRRPSVRAINTSSHLSTGLCCQGASILHAVHQTTANNTSIAYEILQRAEGNIKAKRRVRGLKKFCASIGRPRPNTRYHNLPFLELQPSALPCRNNTVGPILRARLESGTAALRRENPIYGMGTTCLSCIVRSSSRPSLHPPRRFFSVRCPHLMELGPPRIARHEVAAVWQQ